MTNQPVAAQHNHKATTVVVFGLIARSFGLATGVALAILLASALFGG
jgi:hypothetical protein